MLVPTSFDRHSSLVLHIRTLRIPCVSPSTKFWRTTSQTFNNANRLIRRVKDLFQRPATNYYAESKKESSLLAITDDWLTTTSF